MRDGDGARGSADSAWFPELRESGWGQRIFSASVERVRHAGVDEIEFEVFTRNDAALNLYRNLGCETIDELLVWTRKARSGTGGGLRYARRTEESVSRIARERAACWQREARSVAAISRSAQVRIDGAYALVAKRAGHGTLLDAGACDETSAHALLRELDTRIRCDLTLLNEPASSPLSNALHDDAGWRVAERQHRMRLKF